MTRMHPIFVLHIRREKMTFSEKIKFFTNIWSDFPKLQNQIRFGNHGNEGTIQSCRLPDKIQTTKKLFKRVISLLSDIRIDIRP